jgi:hypothetical protein
MPKKAFAPEQTATRLRQVEVLVSQGKTVPLACKEAGIVDQTFYRWRKEYGALLESVFRQVPRMRLARGRCRSGASRMGSHGLVLDGLSWPVRALFSAVVSTIIRSG